MALFSRKRLILFLMIFWSSISYSQETINLMFYNLLNFPEAPPTNRSDILKVIIDNYQPDLFMVCELQSEAGADMILNTSLKTIDNRYKRAEFVYNQSSSSADLQQLAFYNSNKLILESQDEIITDVRDINHYTFKLNSSSTSVYIDAFVAHLKSSQGVDNEEARLQMAMDFTTYLSAIPKDHYVLLAGDFNFYTSNENGYQELIDPTNAIQLIDPLNRPGNWNNNSSFADIHTQSTRTSSVPFDDYGAGGGLDDRFDFILLSQNLTNSTELFYVDNSYKAYGNNGNCFNKSINDTSCTGEFSQSIRNILYNMSDHLPVILSLQTDQVLAVSDNYHTKQMIRFTNGNIINDLLSLKLNPKLLNKSILVYNVLGQQVISKKVTDNEIKIDATHLPNGIYYLYSSNSDFHEPIKFIKV